MSNWKQYKEDFILFLEAGLIAVNQADEDSAMKLFKAAELLEPSNTMTKIGFGYLHLHKLDLKKACKMFEAVLEQDPHNEMAKTMLGISMSLEPSMADKAEKILEQTQHSKDPMIKKLSDTAIDFVEKFIKKTPSPVEGKHKKN